MYSELVFAMQWLVFKFPSSSPVPTFAEFPTLALTSKSEERRQGGRGSSRAAEGSAWKS